MSLVICQNHKCPLSETRNRYYQDNSKGDCISCGEKLPSEYSSEDASDGKIEQLKTVCYRCHGDGIIAKPYPLTTNYTCPKCKGTGKIKSEDASDGRFRKRVEKFKAIEYSKRHLCPSCKNTYPDCKVHPRFGNGVGNDNVIECDGYVAIINPVNDLDTKQNK